MQPRDVACTGKVLLGLCTKSHFILGTASKHGVFRPCTSSQATSTCARPRATYTIPRATSSASFCISGYTYTTVMCCVQSRCSLCRCLHARPSQRVKGTSLHLHRDVDTPTTTTTSPTHALLFTQAPMPSSAQQHTKHNKQSLTNLPASKHHTGEHSLARW
jgi:hypothetical protein